MCACKEGTFVDYPHILSTYEDIIPVAVGARPGIPVILVTPAVKP